MDRVDYLTTRLKSEIGDPIVSALPEELGSIDVAIRLASLKYWTACPYRYSTVLSVDVSRGSYIQSIATLKSLAFTNAPPGTVDLAYYIGILRLSDATFGTSVRSFDSWLLGVPLGSNLGASRGHNFGGNHQLEVIDYDRMLLDSTNFRAMTGHVEYTIDETTQTITYLSPSYFGQINVEHGFGFDDPNMSFIPFNHFDIFCRIASLEFLNIIIRARTSVELNGDFRINISELSKRRDTLERDVNKELQQIAPIVALWG